MLIEPIKVLILDSTLFAWMLGLTGFKLVYLVIGLLITPELISQRALVLTHYFCCNAFLS